MSNYWRARYDQELAKNKVHFETRLNLQYLAGKYGHLAESTGNADLANLVREITEVLDGTWHRPGGGESW